MRAWRWLRRGPGAPWRLYREVKWFLQRGRRGYSDQDAWNLEVYLSMVLSKALVRLADTSHGHPCLAKPDELRGGVPPCVLSAPHCEMDCAGRWDREIRSNAERFRVLCDDPWGSQQGLEAVESTRKEALAWLGLRWWNLWD